MKGLLASLMIKLGLDSSQFKRGMNEAEQKTNKFGNFMKKIGGMIAGAFAVQQIISFGKELVNLGGIAEGVRAAFERIADDKVLQDLKDATHGTVSELELMKRTVQASNFGLPVEKLSGLFEFATKRAQETGESVDYLVNSIVLGISRKSIPILDNLGISATQLREKLGAAGVAGATSFELMTAVNEIASESMRKSGGVIDTNAIKVQNLKSEWDNFKLSLSEDPEFTQAVGKSLNFLNKQLKELPENLKISGRALKFVFGSWIKVPDAIHEYSSAEEEAAAKTEEANKTLEKFSSIIFGLSGNLSGWQKKQEKHIKTIGELKAETDELKKSLDLYTFSQKAEWNATKAQIEANEALIKSFEEVAEVRDLPNGLKQLERPIETPQIAADGVFGDLGVLPLEMDKLNEHMAETNKKAYSLQEEAAANWNNFKEQIAAIAIDFGVDVVGQFGAAFGELLESGKLPEGFGNDIIAQIGDFLAKIGAMFVAYGVAQLDFFKSLAAGPAGAFKLIASGAALVLIGSAITGAANSASRGDIGSSSGSVSTSSYSNASGYGNSSERRDSKVVFELDGTKLRGVLNNVDRKYGLIG